MGPKLREYVDGGNAVETWWYQKEGTPVRSKDLEPVRLPVGQAASLATLFRHLHGDEVNKCR